MKEGRVEATEWEEGVGDGSPQRVLLSSLQGLSSTELICCEMCKCCLDWCLCALEIGYESRGGGLGLMGGDGGGRLSVGRPCHETGSEKANSPTGFDFFMSSCPVTPVLLWLLFRPHILHPTQLTLASPAGGHIMYTTYTVHIQWIYSMTYEGGRTAVDEPESSVFWFIQLFLWSQIHDSVKPVDRNITRCLFKLMTEGGMFNGIKH